MIGSDHSDSEALLRDTLRRHDHPADGAAARLLPAVRAGVAETAQRPTRRAFAGVAVAAAVVVAVAAVPVAVALLGGGSEGPAQVGGSTPAVHLTDPPPEGWRWESSLGLVAAVPDSWVVNDFGCNMTGASSVVRGGGAMLLCFTPEPPTKEVAIFAWYGAALPADHVMEQSLIPAGTPRQEIVLSGLRAERVTTQLMDGRFAAVVLVPDRGAALVVRTRNAETADAILNSLVIVDVDHVGCPVQRPAVTPPDHGGEFVNPAPVAVGLCYYGAQDIIDVPGRLLASGELTGDAATSLATLINAAPKGGNPDPPADQCLAQPAEPEAVLYVRSGDGSVQRIWVSFSGCVHRGLSDGAEQVQVSHGIIAAIMNPLRMGYTFSGDLPE